MPIYEEAHKQYINKYKMAHMIGVAEYMYDNALRYNLDSDQMYVIGLLHDIGYLNGRVGHEQYGANILNKMKLDDDMLFIIKHHGEKLTDIESEYTPAGITKEFILLMEADASVDKAGYRVGFDKRLQDIGEFYGLDSPAYETVKSNIEYIKNWCMQNSIELPKQPKPKIHYKPMEH